MARLVSVLLVLLALALSPAALAAPPPGSGPAASWAQPQIEAVVAAGLMAPSVAEFRPDDPLTQGELVELLAQMGGGGPAPADPSLPVTVAQLDAALVRTAGLGPAAKQFRGVLVAAGLEPGKIAGTEIVARLLGLRLDHTDESLERLPTEPVTRAETAYSVAQLRAGTGSYGVATVATKAAAFSLPALSDWQRRVLARAVSFVGYPYIWAGTSEKAQAPLGKPTPGGFDCSGFVWRVYKIEQYGDAPQLAAVLKGRTTYAMSGEVEPALRIPADALQPGDVVFFGDKGPSSKPAQVGHMGIYAGNGWFIHSSGRGVTLWPLEGWYSERFAWARRPLAEAGLDAPVATEPQPVVAETEPVAVGASPEAPPPPESAPAG